MRKIIPVVLLKQEFEQRDKTKKKLKGCLRKFSDCQDSDTSLKNQLFDLSNELKIFQASGRRPRQ